MRHLFYTTVCTLSLLTTVNAQEKHWSMTECMEYAIENSPVVKQREYEADNYKASYMAATGAFLPGLGASVGNSFSFGRNVDPETNMMANQSSYNNSYTVETNLTLFRGGQLVNQWKQAKVNRLLGKNNEQLAKDELAMEVMDAYINVIFYKGMIKFASDKLVESNQNYYKTSRMEELGLKSVADLAQIEAQKAADDYNLTQYENMYNISMLTLKEKMSYPYEKELVIDTLLVDFDYLPAVESVADIFEYAREYNPTAIQYDLQLKSYKYDYKIAKGNYFPSLSLYGSVGTGYTTIMSGATEDSSSDSFRKQFSDKRGEYISITFSIPLFNRFSYLTNTRKARNHVRIAEAQQTDVLQQLQGTIEKNVLDREGYAKETIQLGKQVKANELAYQLVLRQYEEGLMSPIDVQTTSATLLESRANLLQRKLMYIMKSKIVDYYKGVPFVENR